MTTNSISHNKELSNLAKIYIQNIKFNAHNNDYIFKLANFYNTYSKIYILSKIRIKTFSHICKIIIIDYFFQILALVL